MVAYWLLYDVLKEEGLLEQYGFDSLGDDIPDLSGLEFKSPYDYPSYSEMMDMNITIDDLETCKYNKKETLAEAEKYIVKTYKKHYSSKDNFQTLDFIEALGDAQAFCRGNAMKYLSRFDKKGTPKLDILKAIHYCVLLYHFHNKEN